MFGSATTVVDAAVAADERAAAFVRVRLLAVPPDRRVDGRRRALSRCSAHRRVQKLSVRYFSAPSGKTVTTTPLLEAGAPRRASPPAPRPTRCRPAALPRAPAAAPSRYARSVLDAQILVGERRIVDARHDRRLHVLQPLEAVKRRIGLKRDQLDRRVERPQPAAGADERAARAEAGDEVRQPAARLLDDLRRRSCRSARASSRRCCTDPDRSTDPGSAAYSRRASRIAPSVPSSGLGQHELGAERAQDQLALRARVLRHAQLHLVAARRADHRVGDAGVARRRVEDRAVRASSAPDASPSRIIRAAARSFTDPPGFCHSAFAYSSTPGVSRSNWCSRTSGVRPIRSRTDEPAARSSDNVDGTDEDMTMIYDRTSPDYIKR